jgi:hypothetical protein
MACGCLGSPVEEAYEVHMCQGSLREEWWTAQGHLGSLMEEACEAHVEGV